MLRKLRRLSQLSVVELAVFAQLFFGVLIAKALLEYYSLPQFIAFLSASASNRILKQFPLGHRFLLDTELVAVAGLVARAVRPQGPCLFRSILLLWLLRARGQQVEMFIGVNKESDQLQSHAWVETDNSVLGDNRESILRFATLLRY